MNHANPRIKSATTVEIILLSAMNPNAPALASKFTSSIPSSVEVAVEVAALVVTAAPALVASTGRLTVFVLFVKATTFTGTVSVTAGRAVVVVVVEVELVVLDERLEPELELEPPPELVVVFSETSTAEQTVPTTTEPIESATVSVADFFPAAEYVFEAVVADPVKPSVPDQLYVYGAVPPDTFADHVTESPSLIEELFAEQETVSSVGAEYTVADVHVNGPAKGPLSKVELILVTVAVFVPAVL